MPFSMNLLSHANCFSQPKRRTPLRNWHEHIPFAFFLVDLLKPKVIVELGTHYGDSYCAFCQAVLELHLDSRCYAVDTWKGDPHSGLYGPEILADLRAHHDPLYGGFSRLIESTFDEALRHFETGTIDLLHIDGCHTFEAVAHDFESWLPKLSGRAVVLLHDINVREQDFGVWKAWDKFKAGYPHFEFWHSHGLGVLAVGSEQPKALQDLLGASAEEAASIRRYFFQLGHRVTLEFQKESQESQIQHLQDRERSHEHHIQQLQDRERSLEASLVDMRGQSSALQQSLEHEKASRLADAESRAELVTRLQTLQTELAQNNSRLVQAETTMADLAASLKQRDQDNAALARTRENLSEQLTDLRFVVGQKTEQLSQVTAERDRLSEQALETALELSQAQLTFEAELLQRERHIQILKEAQSGILWNILRSYRGFKDRSFPPGTRRRKAYDRALGLIKTGLGHPDASASRTSSWLTRSLFDAMRHPVHAVKTAGGLTRKAGQILVTEGPQSVLERASGKVQRWNTLGEPVLNAPGWQPDMNAQYADWLTRHEPTDADLARLQVEASQFAYRPCISIVMPVFNVAEPWLRRAVDSVLRQAYSNWELCLVDDASTEPHIKPVIEELASRDRRITTVFEPVNAGIALASNKGLEAGTGEFVAFLDHDDELAPHALFEVVGLLNRKPELDFIYSDEDKIDEHDRRCDPFFKPAWSPDLLLSMNYICHLSIIRRTLLSQIGGFRPGLDGSQDYDLFLRVTERTSRIGHIPKVLYHWRKIPGSAASSISAKPQASVSACLALNEALQRRGVPGMVEMISHGRYRTRYVHSSQPLISIIIPTKDRSELLARCLDSIESRSTYPKYEVLVVDNNSEEEATKRYFREIAGRHTVLSYPHPFNWAAINNFAAKRAGGSYLLFLNNDIEVIEPDWLTAMLEHAQREEVGVVGAKLLFPSGLIQHAGAVLGIGGVCGHAFKGLPAESPGYVDLAKVVRNYSAVTGACMCVRREVFDSVGGFEEGLRVAFSDIDFCLRIRERGLLVVYTPYSVLYHHESATRGTWHPSEDTQFMRDRWDSLIAAGDPYYNPNLSLLHEDFRLRV